jgi:hypothetical protein
VQPLYQLYRLPLKVSIARMRTEQVARRILLQFVNAPPFSLVLWFGITVTYLGVRPRRLTVYFRSSLRELSDLCDSAAGSEQPLFEFVEGFAVIGCENLPVHNGEVNLNLIELTCVDRVCTRSTLGH